MTGRLAQAQDEESLYLDVDGDKLFGIYTNATGAPLGVGVHLMWGSGRFPTSGRGRVRTHLARRLAASGFDALRTDHPGVGESNGEKRSADFDAPEVAEVREAVAYLASRNDRVAVVANCFGGRNVIAAADQLTHLDAVVLVSVPMQDHLHSEAKKLSAPLHTLLARVANPRRWRVYLGKARGRYARLAVQRVRFSALKRVGGAVGWSSAGHGVVATITRWVDDGVAILVLAGERDDFYPDLRVALDGRLGDLVAQHRDLVDVVTLPLRLTAFPSSAIQQEAIEMITGWLEERFAAAAAGAAEAPLSAS